MITFIVVEKSYLVRKGIVSIINRMDNTRVVKELENLDHLNTEINNHQPDYIVLNPNLIPEETTFRNFEIKMDVSSKVIALLSNYPRRQGMHHNFLLTIDINDSKETIISKFRKITESADSSEQVLTSSELSEREKTILQYVAKGYTNKEIASELFLSAHTVITHRKNITAKLGIKTISGLTVYAILNNLVSLNEIN